MTVQQLNMLHRRYVELSDRFRAAWAFHQFIGSLKKIFFKGEETGYPADFQEVYSDLKEVSSNLNASAVDLVRERLDRVDQQLALLLEALLAEDSKISPAYLRKFFHRVKNCDEKILTQLVKFYLFAHQEAAWPDDRLDKVDFLVTRIAADGDRTGVDATPGERKQLREVLRGLWQTLAAEPAEPGAVEHWRRAIEEIRTEAAAITDLEQLQEQGVVGRYRELKHALGHLFFQPDIQLAILDTNLALTDLVQRLYAAEERRVVAEYQQIFELEREVPVGPQLDGELTEFRREIERFEQRLQSDELKLTDLAHIRRRVRSLIPRLTEVSRSQPGAAPPVDEPSAAAVPAVGGRDRDLLGEPYDRLLAALEMSDAEASPRRVISTPELFPFRLEIREVAAYRRLAADQAGDRELEAFLLEAAALRSRLCEEAEEIRSLLDDTSITGDSPLFARARLTSRLADRFVRRFGHAVEQALEEGDLEEARELQLLKMRLLRDFTGLWLLAHRPTYLR